jgi:hypothetical protein
MNNIKFPALIVVLLMVLTPLVDRAINNGAFTALTKVVEGACAVAVVGLVVAGAVNTFKY